MNPRINVDIYPESIDVHLVLSCGRECKFILHVVEDKRMESTSCVFSTSNIVTLEKRKLHGKAE